MTILCKKCRQPFKDDDEVQGMFKSFWHQIESKVNFSISNPHEYISDTLEHVDCDNPKGGEYEP